MSCASELRLFAHPQLCQADVFSLVAIPSLPLSNLSLGAQSLYLLQESLVPLRDALHAYNSLPPVSCRTMAATGDHSKFVS